MHKNSYSLVLASQSPRRQELIKSIFLPFKIRSSNIEEISQKTEPKELVIDLAAQKALAASEVGDEFDVTIGADTIVYLDGSVLGKPNSKDEAREILKKLSGRTHSVFTGVSIQSTKLQSDFAVKTSVTFREVPTDLLELYLNTGESMDKAGAYGIQSYALSFIEKIEGSYSNVVGLPVDHLLIALKELMETIHPEEKEWRSHFV